MARIKQILKKQHLLLLREESDAFNALNVTS